MFSVSMRCRRCRVLLLARLAMSAPAQAANQRADDFGHARELGVRRLAVFVSSDRVSDPESATLRFTIANKPSWATFSTSTRRSERHAHGGRLVDQHPHRVSDGVNTARAAGFSIRATSRDNVAPVISGSPATSRRRRPTYAFHADGERRERRSAALQHRRTVRLGDVQHARRAA